MSKTTEIKFEQTNLGTANTDLDTMNADQLFGVIDHCLAVTVAAVIRMALAFRRLVELGRDRDRPIPFANHLRRIVNHQMLPDVLSRYILHEDLCIKIGRLPIADQKRLAEGDAIEVAVILPNGSVDMEMKRPEELLKMPAVLKRVFATDHIRTIESQAAMLRQEMSAESVRPKIQNFGPLEIDTVSGGGRIAGKHGDLFTVKQLEEALRAFRKKRR